MDNAAEKIKSQTWYLPKNSVVLVCLTDWQGFYVNGILKVENHRLSAKDILPYIPTDHEIRHIDWSGDSLPKNLDSLNNN